MRLATIWYRQKEQAGIVVSKGIIPIVIVNIKMGTGWQTEIWELIQKGELETLTDWYRKGGQELIEQWTEDVILWEQVEYRPLYRNPRRIFGIGLNYRDHAKDLKEAAPKGFPGSFYKPASSIIGHGDKVQLPAMPEAQKTTGEAELGIIIGKKCRFIHEADWQEYVAGYTSIIDMTEESILRQNPRFLTIAKGFDTFFSFGPQLVTPDEITDVLALEVQTVHNGSVYAKNTVSNMTHLPSQLVSLISHMQGWLPGDLLSTGTPRAVKIQEGDQIECRIFGPNGFQMEPLVNPVIDLKLRKDEA